MGSRISNMTDLATGELVDPSKSYVVAGWASVNEHVEGPAVYDLMENYLSSLEVVTPTQNDAVKIVGQ
jgi:sulfur-oxidizing protein SoxB